MLKLGSVFLVMLLTAALALPARALPVLDYGVSAFVFLDAGGSHWFVNAGGAGVTDTGPITQGVSDTARGGAQIASTSAYARLGSLGGNVLASTGGALLETAQGSNDLTWYTDFLVTGAPGTKVAYTFGTGFDALITAAGERAGGRVQATTFVANAPLADWVLSASTFDGAGLIDQFAIATYEFDVGTVIRLAGRLGVSAHADIEGSVESDALHTANFYVDVLTRGGGYVAGGGVVFPTLPLAAVPEPSAAGLLAVGLVLLGWMRNRPWRRGARRAVALLGAAVAAPAALSTPVYGYVTLDVPGAVETQACGNALAPFGAVASAAFDINDAGEIIGRFGDSEDGYILATQLAVPEPGTVGLAVVSRFAAPAAS